MGRQAFTPRGDAADAIRVLSGAIRAARLERGWTQPQLANAIGVSIGTIHNIERGSHTTSIGHVLSAAAVLGLPLFATDAEGWARQARATTLMDPLLPRHIGSPSREVAAGRDF